MSKSINKPQADILLSRMQEKPEIARGFVKERKEKVAEFWKKLTVELNSAGPPIKSEFEWKKAWNDQKRYVRRKASLNKVYERGTGGGPNRTQKFSPAEETIFQLVGMKEAVDGVDAAHSYGFTSTNKRKRSHNENELALEIVNDLTSVESTEQQSIEAQNEFAASSNASPTVPLREVGASNSQEAGLLNKKVNLTTKDMAYKELENQRELCNKVAEAITLSENNHKEMQINIKRIYRSLDRLYEQQKIKIDELKRHNQQMETFRKMEIENKIEKNRKMLELEKTKVDIMRNNNF